MSKRRVAIIGGSLFVLAILVAAVFISGKVGAATGAAAETPTAGSVAAHSPVTQVAGKIGALQVGGFTLTLQNQRTYTVTVAPLTWIVVSQGGRRVDGTLADLQAGDTVQVGGKLGPAGIIEARVILQNPPAAAARPGQGQKAATGAKAKKAAPSAKLTPGAPPAATPAAGPSAPLPKVKGHGLPGGLAPSMGNATISALGNGSLTLAIDSQAQPLTIRTDGDTLVVKGGMATLADLQVGDKVQIYPRQLTLAATPAAAATPPPAAGTLTPAPASAPAGKPGARAKAAAAGAKGSPPMAGLIYVPGSDARLISGELQSTSGNSFVVITFMGNDTFTTGPQTVFKSISSTAPVVSAAGSSDLTPGSRVYVYGPKVADGQTAAAGVVLIEPAPMP